MSASFQLVSFETVLSSYSFGENPIIQSGGILEGIPKVIGYAPYVQIQVENTSSLSPYVQSYSHQWDFNDYYNYSTNRPQTNDRYVEHRFVMPGIYSISLVQTQNILDPELPPPNTEPPSDYICPSLHSQNWDWFSLSATHFYATTWEQVSCVGPKQRTWNDEATCFGKYCRSWSWKNLKCDGGSSNLNNPTTWLDTQTGADYVKQWRYEPNTTTCEASGIVVPIPERGNLNLVDLSLQAAIIEVREIPPIAVLHISEGVSGPGKITATITPQFSRTGSFPLDVAEWDVYGDGSLTYVLWREELKGGNIPAYFEYNGAYFQDPADPRNYSLVYEFNRTSRNSVYYPSLKIQAANTKSEDRVCITIGPIPRGNSTIGSNLQLEKIYAKETPVYALKCNDQRHLFEPALSSIALRENTLIPPCKFSPPASRYPQIGVGAIIDPFA